MLQQLNSPRSSGTNIYSCSKMTFLSFIWARGPGDHGTVWLVTRPPWHQMSVTVTGLSSGPRECYRPHSVHNSSRSTSDMRTPEPEPGPTSQLCHFVKCVSGESHRDLIEWYRGEWITEYFTSEKVSYFNLTAFKYLHQKTSSAPQQYNFSQVVSSSTR